MYHQVNAGRTIRRIAAGFAVALSTALCSPATSLRAQVTVPAVDDLIRLRAPGVVSGRWTGTVVSSRADTLAVRAGTGEVRLVPRSAITQLERSRGRSRGAGARKGALWGTGVGVGLALLNAGFSDRTCDPEQVDCVSTSTGVLLWTAMGLGVGTVVGAVRGSERWERLPIGVALTRRGQPAVGVSLLW